MPGQPSAVASAERVAVVLDQPQVVLPDEVHDRVEVERSAQGVGQHDRPGARPDGGAQLLGIGVVVAQPTSTNTGHQPVLDDRRDRGGEARGDGDDLVARLQPPVTELGRRERGEGDQVGRRARVDEQRIGQPEIVREPASNASVKRLAVR